jgi:flagellar motor switch protein FliN/FliY
MFSQEDIDAVLNDAQDAVEALVNDVDGLDDAPGTNAGAPSSPVAQTAAPSSQPAATMSSRPLEPPPSAAVQSLLKLEVPVIVRLAQQRMLVSEVMKLVPGTILEFDRRCDQELDLLVNTHQIGAGVAVKVDEHFGLRVTFIGDLEQRLQSLAG